MFNKGDPINPQILEDTINQAYKSLLSSIVQYIPLGFNTAYSIIAEKIFKIRPKVLQNAYSSRSGAILNNTGGDLTQSQLGVAYLGSPYTLELGQALGVGSYMNFNLGDSSSPFIKEEPILPYNPSVDLINGIPLKGNSPMLWRGYLCWSNFFEDSNAYLTISTSGDNIVFSAKSISLLSRASLESSYTIGTDSLTQYPDRSTLEMKHLQDFTGTLPFNRVWNNDGTGGCYEVDITHNKYSSGDHMVWLVQDSTYGTAQLLRVSADIDHTTVSGVVNQIYPGVGTLTSNGIEYPWIRPLGVVYCEDGKFISSNQTAWGETVSDSNVDSLYGKIFQQTSSPDTAIRNNTRTDDRRVVPSNVYIDQKNNTLIGKTVYSGLVRHIPSCGGNNIRMQLQSYNSIGQSSLKLDIGQCELTDGTTSIWVKDLDLPEINLTITETLKSLGTMGDGYNYKGNLLGAKGYLWLCADPANVLQPSQGTDNLRLKLFLSQSPTWNQDWKTSAPIRYGNPGVTEWDSSVVNVGPTSLGTSYNTYTHRCRIGYINHYYSSGVAESSYGYVMNNGVYTMSENFLPKTSQGNTNVPSILMGQASALLGTGVTTNGVYTRIQTTNNINLSSNFMNLPYFGSQGTSLACTKVTIGLRYDSGGTAEVGTSWVAVTSYDHANSYHGAGTVGTKPSPLGYGEPAILGLERVTTNKGSCLKTKTSFFDIPIKVDGINYLCYAGTGGDNTIHTRAAWVSGFYLPIGNF